MLLFCVLIQSSYAIMRILHIRYLLLIFLLSFSALASADDKKENSGTDLLIISSYVSGAPWSQTIISHIMQKEYDRKDVSMNVEYMNILTIETPEILNQYKENLFSTYGNNPPKAVLMLGNAPLILRDDMRRHWGDIPLIVCAESRYIGPDSTYMYNQIIPYKDRIYLKDLRNEYNMTFLAARAFIPESVQLLRRMIPKMKSLLLIGDQTDRDIDYDQQLSELINTEYTDINYKFLSAGAWSPEQLLDTLRQVVPEETGILFASWFHKRMFAGNMLMMANSYKVIANSTLPCPFFALSSSISSIEEDGTIIGGCVYDMNLYCEEIVKMINAVADGKQARDIPYYDPKPMVLFNYPYMVDFGLSPKNCPPGTIYLNAPPTFFEKYRSALVVGSIVLLLVVLFFQLRRNKILEQLQLVEQNQRFTHSKMAMALEVVDLLPWQWDLRTDEITYSSYKPIEQGKKEVSEMTYTTDINDYLTFVCEEDRERIRQVFKDVRANKVDRIKEEYRVHRPGKPYDSEDWMEARAFVEQYDEKGNPLIVVGSSLFITERKIAERELIAAKERAEESNRLKSAFLANISHEIRTPLNAIIGFSSILAMTEDEEEKKEYVSIIEKNNGILLQLINDVLDLSKIEAGVLDLYYSEFGLNGVLATLKGVVESRLQDGVDLIFEPGMPDDYVVYSEKNRLQQLVLNFLSNACKFTSTGSIRYGYEVRDKDIYYYVTDTGTGIPEDKLHLIFERFIKLDSFKQGTGLGLPICQLIIQNMGGEIGVNSKLGEGSTFWFTLPLKPKQ